MPQLCVVYHKATLKMSAPKMFPSVTGIWFQNHHCEMAIGAPHRIPIGNTNILTMECSNPSAKNVAIGSQMSIIFPETLRAPLPKIGARLTSQLQSTLIATADNQPETP